MILEQALVPSLKLNKLDTIIIGAGISGLSYAWQLNKTQQDFLIVEKQESAGGNWHSFAYKNSIYELGPNSFVNRYPQFENLIDDIGFRDQVIIKAFKDSNRYIYLDEKLIEVKPGPGLLFSGLLSFKGILRALSEPLQGARLVSKDSEESVHSFFARHFGDEIAERIVANALQGVWAGDTKQLSIKACMPKLKEMEEKHGSILKALFMKSSKSKDSPKEPLLTCSFQKGLRSFCSGIQEKIGDKHFRFGAQSKICKLEADNFEIEINQEIFQCKNLVIATKAGEAAQLLENQQPNISTKLSSIYYAPVCLIAFSLKKDLFKKSAHKKMQAFGFISGKAEDLTLGTIFSSQVFDERELEDEYLMTSFLGGALNSQITEYDINKLIEKMCQELGEVFRDWTQTKLEVDDFQIIQSKFIPKAIPQYQANHNDLTSSIQEELKELPGLNLIGNYFAGVSMADSIKFAQKTMLD